MTTVKIKIINITEGSKQETNGKWMEIVRLKFVVPQFTYKNEVKIGKDKYDWDEAKEEIKRKLKKHLEEVFIPIEYEEVI